MQEKGTISIHTENIFPIIKKFLYSDHEIFLRELVSNAVDATQKLSRLSSLGEFKGELGELKVKVAFDQKAKTITVTDSGIGMTGEEIKKYINQIAFSGASEFLEKYKDKGEENQIIGHFGLGFYSAFMVADKVEIITKSYKPDAQPAKWICDGSTEFEITKAVKKEYGTEIILHINEESKEFLEKARIEQILTKYCKFLPVEVEFEGEIINETAPIWTKPPAELKDEDYLKFYKELYPMSGDPLFWIHLNVDYPFNLTGILYFPKIKNDFEIRRNKIQLYSRQVFITDEVKDVVPEFLMLLHGVIDSPDIPLNVSRSFLQADANVKKINGYITKKVADKLGELFKNDRKAFEEKWNDIGVFVKYGMLSEEKFNEKAAAFALLKNTENEFFTTDEYKEKVSGTQTDKDKNINFLYCNDPEEQHSYITAARKRGYDVLVFDTPIDNHFIQHLETKTENSRIKRVDSDTVEKLIDTGASAESVLNEEEKNKVIELFKSEIGEDKMITLEPMAPDDMPVTVILPEFMRRMKEMSAMGGSFGEMPNQVNIAVNANHPLLQKILKAKKKGPELIRQCYDLALLSQGMLKGEKLTDFIQRSITLTEGV